LALRTTAAGTGSQTDPVADYEIEDRVLIKRDESTIHGSFIACSAVIEIRGILAPVDDGGDVGAVLSSQHRQPAGVRILERALFDDRGSGGVIHDLLDDFGREWRSYVDQMSLLRHVITMMWSPNDLTFWQD